MEIAIIVGLLAMTLILVYYGTGFFRMNQIGYKTFGVMINSIASFLVIGIAFVMLEMSAGTSYNGFMGIVFQFTWIFITVGNLIAYVLIMAIGAYGPTKEIQQIQRRL